jgi:hypothetical protein
MARTPRRGGRQWPCPSWHSSSLSGSRSSTWPRHWYSRRGDRRARESRSTLLVRRAPSLETTRETGRFLAQRGLGLWYWPCGQQSRPQESNDSRSASNAQANRLRGAEIACGASLFVESGLRRERNGSRSISLQAVSDEIRTQASSSTPCGRLTSHPAGMAKAVACTKGRARTQVRLTRMQKVEGSSRPESPVPKRPLESRSRRRSEFSPAITYSLPDSAEGPAN